MSGLVPADPATGGAPLPPPADLVDLSGRVIVVTGAGGGIGRGVATRLSQAGAEVVAHTRSSPVDLTDRDGGPIPVVAADLTTVDGPADLVAATLELRGRIDGLVNNAAIQTLAPLADLADADWRAMIDTDLTAAHRLTRLAAAAMIEAGRGGTVVHIASIEATQPAPDHEHYGVAKAGLVMHAKAAASAYGRHGIRVNAVSPGLVDRAGLAEQWPEGVARWVSSAPLGRLGTPADVGDACVFLCSDLSRWITGIDLVVDGGVLTRPTW
jgi:NAD(P)-dependent dehydrogenase (short-subunit alcohol dehydrogenase family)